MINKYWIFVAMVSFVLSIRAQRVVDFWQPVSLSDLSSETTKRIEELPGSPLLYRLDLEGIMGHLLSEKERGPDTAGFITTLNFPIGNGNYSPLRLRETTAMHPELQLKYPEIMSFTGKAKVDQDISLQMSTSASGINGMIRFADGISIRFHSIDPKNNLYTFYELNDISKLSGDCYFDATLSDAQQPNEKSGDFRIADDGFLRKYRLAVTSTAEYTDFVLLQLGVDPGESIEVKTDAVLSELNNMVAYLNSIYERELAISFELVASNDDIIFFDTATDGLTHNNRFQLFSENQVVQDAIIQSVNYDIGHVLDNANFGGVGEIASVCQSISKAKGVTGTVQLDEAFYLLVAHEIGHQLGANHTFNDCKASLPATAGGSAIEPGSGTTIMAYPGSCDISNNIQSFRDPYFNRFSLNEIWNTVLSSGNCATLIPIGNNEPLISVPLTDYTIPTSTPFELDIAAADADDDQLTFSWEQQDAELVTAPPAATLTEGPVFRSRPPALASRRSFPELGTILDGALSNTWEVLPSVGRTLNFSVIVRDNNPSGGQIATDETTVTIDGGSGPFQITTPAAFEIWDTGETRTIEWDVANTDLAPVSCANVDILLSLDGGLTFDIVLASSTPNDGSQSITVPGELTLFGRVKIQCSDNIFFDVSTEIEISVDGQPTKTAIPDPSFETALRYLGFDNDGPNNNGTVNTRDIIDITELNIANTDLPAGYNTITDLTGIEDFESLVYLQCFNNQISTMDLSQNTSLQILLCRDNNLTSLDLSQNTSLTQLNCIRNDLTYISVKNGNNGVLMQLDARLNPELSCIDVDDALQANIGSSPYGSWLVDSGVHYSENCAASTYIPDTNFEQYLLDNAIDTDGVLNKNVLNSDISGITNLIIPNLGISDLTGIEGFSSLTVLSAEMNSISSVDLSANLQLQSLILSDNAISDIDLSANLNLFEINLSGNNISSLNLQANTNLFGVLVNDNALQQLDLSLHTSLIFVECRNNSLDVFDISNGANSMMSIFDARGNSELYCIQVDDAAWSTANWTNVDAQTIFSEACEVRFSPMAYLQGPSLNPNGGEEGLMRDDLRVLGHIPLQSPYPDGLTCDPTVLQISGINAIVDWVEIELRDPLDNQKLILRRSGLLQRDGDIVDVDGSSPLTSWVGTRDYFVGIRHRNHLGILSANTISLSGIITAIDFITGNVPTYGSNSQTDFGMPAEILGLWAGDADGSGTVRFSGSNNDANVIKDQVLADPSNLFNSVTFGSSGYINIDLNMDGTGRFSGSNNDSNLIKDNVLVHPGNLFNSTTFVIQGTVPPLTN